MLAWASRDDDGVGLRWLDAAGPDRRATSFAVYRVEGRDRSIDVDDAANLIATVRAERAVVQRFVDTTAEPGRQYSYVVTALDRIWNESAPSKARIAR